MGGKGKKIAAEAKSAADTQLKDFQAQTRTAQAAVDKQKKAYQEIDFKNPYAGVQNAYANMNMENFAEDLTVNQQQAQFQAQQGAQQRSNIMQNMRGAAGGSGIAGLAQAMANQGQLQTQQISASIGAQESANQAARVAGAQDVQRRRELQATGAASADLQRRQGAAMVQEAESGRAATLLGMEYGALAGAQEGVQAAYANQQSAMALDMERQAANKQVWGDVIGGVGSMFSGAAASAMQK
jgi:hypothetical protein